MKSKYTYLCIGIILVLALLVGCGQTGSNNPAGITGGPGEIAPNPGGGSAAELVGTWLYVVYYDYRQDYKLEEYLTFYSNGEYDIIDYWYYWDDYYENWVLEDVYSVEGTYSVSGNQITLYYEGVELLVTYSISDDQLTLTMYDPEDDEYYSITFIRYYGKSNKANQDITQNTQLLHKKPCFLKNKGLFKILNH